MPRLDLTTSRSPAWSALLAGLCALTGWTASAHANKLAVDVKAYPESALLCTSRARQSIVVQATYADGTTQDVTASSTFELADPKIAKLVGQSLLPLADGKTTLVIKHQGKTLSLPVETRDAAKDRPISFNLDVMPVFMRAGCNTGSCHGAARGKDGFRLSLFGFDPEGDLHRITREQATRRINLGWPEQSLLMLKATGATPHTGGQCFDTKAPEYDAMMRWLVAGAPADKPDVAKVTDLQVLPPAAVLEGEGASQRMTVIAKYSDGTTRDVTNLCLYMSSNESSAAIGKDGVVQAKQRGEAYVLARFSTFAVGSQVIVIPKGVAYEWPKTPENNYVDGLVFDKFKKLRILPSELCTDEVFLRRVFLDVIGLLPTRAEYDRFMADTAPDKRAKLVEELTNRKEFVELWVMKFAELLQIKSNNDRMSYKATLLYYNWLQDKLADNVPMNVIVQELLGSTGGVFKSPATNYYQVELDNLRLTENVAQVFMGMRLQCAQCHNHPFDRWTMDDYYSFSAFFSQIGRKRGSDPRETIIFNSGGGEVKHPLGGRTMPPQFLGGEKADVAGKDRRKVLAEWLASPKNPYFARNLGNMVWAHFFGMGIIDPVDDVRISNPASNPQLLDGLAEKFTGYNYDFKKLVRDICSSRTYQLSSRMNDTNRLDFRNFSRASIRRMRAEVLWDVISEVTLTSESNKFKGLPKGARAVQIADGEVSSYFLTTFGRATRDTVCSCEVKMEPNLSQALHLLNGPTVNDRVANGGVVRTLLKEGKTPAQVIEDLYIRTLTRKPTPEETQTMLSFLEGEKDPVKPLNDAFWALLNSKEFLFNH